MQLTVCPASSQICRVAVQALLEHPSKPRVIGLYRNLDKVPPEFSSHSNFTAVRGDLSDESSLDFKGSDGVLVMSPPVYDGSDLISSTNRLASNVRAAVTRAGSVTRLVYVSSVGAQHDKGVGEIKCNHLSEVMYRDAAPEVVFLRNAYFMENWSSATDTIKQDRPHFYSVLGQMDYKIPMVSVFDIGRKCADELVRAACNSHQQPRIINFEGPQWYSTRDVHAAFEEVTGKTIEAKLVQKDELAGFFGQFLPEALVGDFVEMTLSMFPGGLLGDEAKDLTPDCGSVPLVEAVRAMWQKGEK